jgi:hypothetical protein
MRCDYRCNSCSRKFSFFETRLKQVHLAADRAARDVEVR